MGFAYPLPITVICELVGVPEADRAAWHRWSTALATMDRETTPVVAREMIAHVHDLIARRRADPADDLLTAHLISNATLALLTHPDQLDRLRADPDLWPGAVHELMRWCSPGADRPCPLCGGGGAARRRDHSAG